MNIYGRSPTAQQGIAVVGPLRLPCALGRGGRRALKREGDGATPIGVWPIRGVLYRADRVKRPTTGLTVAAIRPHDGWCDDPRDRNYNRLVALPYPAGHEVLWRDDHLYDLVVVLGYNDVPRSRSRGSAIFMHLAAPGFTPTEGCIAFREADLRKLLAAAGPGAAVRVTV
ncbi:L,D-transpeptidase family protein [Dichotomicrobium thermohalophilum]|uniref:L,D-transpeptidase family protein n=1 Tax=Dichotomicrobium thermohalophilum TaxID=933063 RepID=UPI00315DDB6D